jgi:hypothetical protein
MSSAYSYSYSDVERSTTHYGNYRVAGIVIFIYIYIYIYIYHAAVKYTILKYYNTVPHGDW